METVLIITSVTSLGIAIVAAITSLATCYRSEQLRQELSHELTTFDIENSETSTTTPEGVQEQRKYQKFKFSDLDRSSKTSSSKEVRTGEPNKVAEGLVGSIVSQVSNVRELIFSRVLNSNESDQADLAGDNPHQEEV